MIICYTVPEIWCVTDVIISQFGPILALLYPNRPKNQNLKKKWKKTSEDIIILHKHTKNNHMLYCSWDMIRNRFNCYFLFWAIFCPFTSLTARKILKKFWKNEKNAWRYHLCTKNHDYMLYCSWDMVLDGCNYFSFWAIFCTFNPLTARKIEN